MSQADIFSQFKNMDKGEREALLGKVMSALSPEQMATVRSIMGDKESMEKVQKNLKPEDIEALLSGLSGKEDPRDFLKSPRVQKRMKDLLR